MKAPIHNIKFKFARVADHDAFVGHTVSGAASPVSADKALHESTIWEFLF